MQPSLVPADPGPAGRGTVLRRPRRWLSAARSAPDSSIDPRPVGAPGSRRRSHQSGCVRVEGPVLPEQRSKSAPARRRRPHMHGGHAHVGARASASGGWFAALCRSLYRHRRQPRGPTTAVPLRPPTGRRRRTRPRSRCNGRLGRSGPLCEHGGRDLVGVERSCGAGICLEVDEKLDDLIFAGAVVESDPQLPAERLVGAERGGDRH